MLSQEFSDSAFIRGGNKVRKKEKIYGLGNKSCVSCFYRHFADYSLYFMWPSAEVETMNIQIICDELSEFQKQGLLFGINNYRKLGEMFSPGREMGCDGRWFVVGRLELVMSLEHGGLMTIYLDKVKEAHADTDIRL